MNAMILLACLTGMVVMMQTSFILVMVKVFSTSSSISTGIMPLMQEVVLEDLLR